jgi:hypothetical protein
VIFEDIGQSCLVPRGKAQRIRECDERPTNSPSTRELRHNPPARIPPLQSTSTGSIDSRGAPSDRNVTALFLVIEAVTRSTTPQWAESTYGLPISMVLDSEMATDSGSGSWGGSECFRRTLARFGI